MADSGCGKCVHTAQSTASTPAPAQPQKQCQPSCQAELLPCHNPMAQGQPKVMVWVTAHPNHIRKHRREKQRPEDFPSPQFSPETFSFLLSRQKLKYGTGLGFIPCLLKEIPPYSPLPSSLVLGQFHLVDAWKLGSIQHLKICLLRLLLQALANFLTNKHLPVKLEMEILIK